MKHTLKRIFSIVLCVLLLIPSVLSTVTFAEEAQAVSDTGLFDGQLSIPVVNTFTPAVQDGTISPTEYGYSTPILVATGENGLWAEDLDGNLIPEKIPESVSLYLSQDDGALYVGIVVKEEAHQGDYKLDVFLGFGNDTNRYTVNSGITNSYYMTEKKHASEPYSWLDFRIQGLSATVYDENGEASECDRRYSNVAEFPLPRWARVSTDAKGKGFTTYEVELNFQDAVEGSGKTWTSTPGTGYFAFDLALYEGTEQCGTLHFGAPAQEEEMAVPHVLNLSGGNAGLASLSVDKAVSITPDFSSGKFEYDVLLPYGVPVSVTAIPTEENATVTVEGEKAIGANGDGQVTIKVSPANGAPAKYYILNIVRQRNVTSYKVSSEELQDTLNTVVNTNWATGAAVEINVTGALSSESEALLGLKTAFDSSGRKVPITINGNGNTTITLAAGKAFSTNDLTLKNLTIQTEGMEFFAGCGNVILENVSFVKADGSTPEISLFADNFTDAAFAGWTKAQVKANKGTNGKINTSLTLAGNFNYQPAENLGVLIGAVGYGEKAYEGAVGAEALIKPEDTTATLIIDGATLSQVGARVGTAPVSLATVQMKNGTVQSLYGDNASSEKEIDAYKGSTTLSVSGGQITGETGIRGLNHAYLSGDLTIEVSGSASVTSILSSQFAEVEGCSYLNISGGTFSGMIQGSGSNLNTINNISGGTFTGEFSGIGSGSTRKVFNNVSGGTFTGGFYGGGDGSGMIRGIVNNITGSALLRSGNFFGGNKDGIVSGSIQNNISTSEGIPTNYRGGSSAGTVKGNITNTFENLVVNGSVYCGNYTATLTGNIQNTFIGAEFLKSVYGGNYKVSAPGNIQNRISGSTFQTGFFGGNYTGNVKGNITNTVESGTFTLPSDSTLSGCYFGGNYSGNVNGTVQNKISGGTFKKYAAFGNLTGNTGIIKNTLSGGSFYRFYGGNWNGATISIENTFNSGFSTSNWICGGNQYGNAGSITNTVNGGTFNGLFHSGNRYDTVGNITNKIYGGNLKSSFAGGGSECNITGTIQNIIDGGNFAGAYYGGNASNGTIGGSIQNTIKKGTFASAFYGGSASGTVANNITNTFEGGTFNGAVYGGNKAGTVSGIITNNKTGGTFNSTFTEGTAAGENIVPDTLAGKTALFVGDSISYGYGDSNHKSWAERISESTGLVSFKNAVSGTSVSDVRKSNQGIIVDQLSYHAGFDYVMLHGGVNDAWSNAPVGTMSDSFSPADFDTSTFAGGLENLIYTAIQKYGSTTTKIGYLINFQAPSHSKVGGDKMVPYVAMTKTICEKWGIQYFDMYYHDEITESLDMTNSESTYKGDLIHPVDAKYDILTPYITEFMHTLQPLSQGILDQVK